MAKVGEGDERWIVEERKDGRNVNGWHWEEKNALSWSRETIQRLLMLGKKEVNHDDDGSEQKEEEEEEEEATTQFCIQVKGDGREDTQRLGVTGLKDASGDASVSFRKGGKKLAVYDLTLTFNWEAELVSPAGKDTPATDVDAENGSSSKRETIRGEIVLKEFATENDEDEYEWSFNVTDSKCSKDASKESKQKAKRMIAKSKDDILKVLRQYSSELTKAFS